MWSKRNTNNKSGFALLMVLIITMAITILSFGFLSRSDTDLRCGDNMILRTETDYLAESALEHAKGLILTPQDVSGEYWSGATTQQLTIGSDYYYDVSINKLGECDYQVVCEAYKQKDGQRIGRSSFQGQLRLDPCIAYWQGGFEVLSLSVTINGDLYCDNDLTIMGMVNGDVYARRSITGTLPAGQRYANTPAPPLTLPPVTIDNYKTGYYIGSTYYSTDIIAANDMNNVMLGPTEGNPAGVYYYNGNLSLYNNVHITGTLVVDGDLRMEQGCNVSITAVKNFPALIVGQDIEINNNNQILNITGLTQVSNRIDMENRSGSSINVLGALYIYGDGIRNTDGCSVTVTASPDKAAIQLDQADGSALRWTPAAGAFYKNIQRL